MEKYSYPIKGEHYIFIIFYLSYSPLRGRNRFTYLHIIHPKTDIQPWILFTVKPLHHMLNVNSSFLCLRLFVSSSVLFALFPFFPVFSQWAKNGVSGFLMTYPLMHILCNVLIHIWKEANSQHKYLIRTFYIPTSHISINCKMCLWAHNLQLC